MADRVRSADRKPLRRRLAFLVAAAGGALFVIVVLIAASVIVQTQRRDEIVDRIDPAQVALLDLRVALADQETGLRGFALVGDGAFLAPYRSGLEDQQRARARLDGLVGGSSVLADRLAVVDDKIEAWQAQTAQPTLDGDEQVRAADFQDAGRDRFDEIRAALQSVDEELHAERDLAMGELDSAVRAVAIGIGLLAVVVAATAVVLFVALRRSVTTPIETLAQQVRLVAEGELQRPVEGNGSVELVELGADIELMRRRIIDELDRLTAATAAIERQAAELARSNADLEQFAYVASHDLQEPLRKVAGFCQLLERRYGGQLDERADEYIHFAVDGAQRMQDLINDLLAFSRVGRTTERFEPVDLGAVAASAVDNLALAMADAGARIEIGELPSVDGDRRLLVALFQNLVANGLKFRGEDPPAVTISATRDGDETTITVSDNGIGIDAEYGDQIFVLFKRLHAKQEYPGTGIGLALCKRIVEFHGGRIWFEPGDPPGATFRFTMPLLQPVAPSGDASAEGTTSTAAVAAGATAPNDPEPQAEELTHG